MDPAVIITAVAAVLTLIGGFIAWLTYVARGVGRIEEKIDGHSEAINSHRKWLVRHDKEIDELCDRTTAIEART